MPTNEEIKSQQALLDAHRQTLSVYLQQRAMHAGAYTPPAVEHGIREARANIKRIKATLRGWGVAVTDHPDDEEPRFGGGAGRASCLERFLFVVGFLICLTGMGLFFMTFLQAWGSGPGDPLPTPIGLGIFFVGFVIVALGALLTYLRTGQWPRQ